MNSRKNLWMLTCGVVVLSAAISTSSCARESAGQGDLYSQVQTIIENLDTCSDFTITPDDANIIITGATPSLEKLKSGLPKSEMIKYNQVVNVPDNLCAFIADFKKFEQAADGSNLFIKGPGRKSVASGKSRKSIKISFNYNQKREFARMYYLEWSPEGVIQEVVDLNNEESSKASFGSTTPPLARDGKSFALAHEDYGSIKLSGFGTRLFVLVQSEGKLELDTSSPEHWLRSIKSAHEECSEFEMASTWVELHAKK